MKIGFVVNDIQTEQATFTTTRLAMTAVNQGHECYTLGVGDFVYAPDGSIHAHAKSVSGDNYDSLQEYLKELQSDDRELQKIKVNDLDILLLRNDPSEDAAKRPWAQSSGILFGQLAASSGVIVLNDPVNLANAINKTYFQHFPEQVRPRTCISRDAQEIKAFIAQQQDNVVIKPLQGSGGQSVFLIGEDERANLNQMIEAVLRDGYCIAQEYLPAAAEGDVRLFVMNGRALRHQGKYAAFRRVNQRFCDIVVGTRSESLDRFCPHHSAQLLPLAFRSAWTAFDHHCGSLVHWREIGVRRQKPQAARRVLCIFDA